MENERLINVFIIEDNSLFAAALKQFLLSCFVNTNNRIAIHTFKNSESCIQWLNNPLGAKPDVIILDYFLNSQYPESMDGIKAMFHLKLIKPNVEIIFLSAHNDLEVAVEAFRMGAYDYIIKNDHSFKNIYESIQKCLVEIKLADKVNKN